MTMKTLWSKVEALVLWPFASILLLSVVYGLVVYRSKIGVWPFWSQVLVLVVAIFWWAGFKSRLAKFLRESLR